jgi:hypothetical protein
VEGRRCPQGREEKGEVEVVRRATEIPEGEHSMKIKEKNIKKEVIKSSICKESDVRCSKKRQKN